MRGPAESSSYSNELPTDGYSHVSIVTTRTNKLTNASQFYTMCTAPPSLGCGGVIGLVLLRKARFLFHCCHRPGPRIELYLKRLEPSRIYSQLLEDETPLNDPPQAISEGRAGCITKQTAARCQTSTLGDLCGSVEKRGYPSSPVQVCLTSAP